MSNEKDKQSDTGGGKSAYLTESNSGLRTLIRLERKVARRSKKLLRCSLAIHEAKLLLDESLSVAGQSDTVKGLVANLNDGLEASYQKRVRKACRQEYKLNKDILRLRQYKQAMRETANGEGDTTS